MPLFRTTVVEPLRPELKEAVDRHVPLEGSKRSHEVRDPLELFPPATSAVPSPSNAAAGAENDRATAIVPVLLQLGSILTGSAQPSRLAASVMRFALSVSFS